MAGAHRQSFLVAVHVFLLRDGNVLLLRRFNTGFADGRYSVPAGHLDGNESVVAAAIREAREEVGVVLQPADLTVVGVMHRREGDERIDFFLAVTRWEGEIVNAEPEKCDEVAWFSLERLPENAVPYVAKALANYRAGIWFDSFGWDETVGSTDGGAAGH